MRTSRALIAAAATALIVAGCSTDSAGTALAEGESPDAVAVAAEQAIDPATLDTGGYNIEPRDFIAEGQLAADFGPAVEGQRMAEFIVLPHTIDPQLTDGSGRNTGVFVGGLGMVVTGGADAVAKQHGVITGFSSFRNNPDDSRELGVGVWRFPDPEAATQAAQGMHRKALHPDETDSFASGPHTEVALPQLPGTLASTYRWETIDTDSTETFTARGPHVIYTYTGADGGDTAWTTYTAVRTVQEQTVLLDRFPATPTEEIGALPVDLDKVLTRAVGFLETEYARNSDTSIYGPHGWLHFDSHPAQTAAIFESTGTDRIAKANSNVYRTAGNEDARTLRETFTGMVSENYPDLVDDPAPQNLPDTECVAGDTTTGRIAVCLMVYGPYMAELVGHRPVGNTDPDSDTLRTMSQRLAAQYAKFVKAEEMGLGEN